MCILSLEQSWAYIFTTSADLELKEKCFFFHFSYLSTVASINSITDLPEFFLLLHYTPLEPPPGATSSILFFHYADHWTIIHVTDQPPSRPPSPPHLHLSSTLSFIRYVFRLAFLYNHVLYFLLFD